MKKIILVLLVILTIVFFLPPFVNYIVSTPSIFGYIPLNEKDTWIGFYGAIIGGLLTLLGVGWSISYTERARKKDQENHERERKEELNRRDEKFKNDLSVRYKPILDITCHPDLIADNENFSLSKYDGIYIQNNISLCDRQVFQTNEKRLNVILIINNIGRGEAIDLLIESKALDIHNTPIKTKTRFYKSVYESNGIEVIFTKILSEEEWKLYDDKILENPFRLELNITYMDLVNKKYMLKSKIIINRFIHSRNENNEKVEKALIVNPYDTLIINEII